jgi:hypothetical protein
MWSDVAASFKKGYRTLLIVECKYWQKPVSKIHVLALREIVSDLGADRGVLLAEAGFQSGAKEAAQLTNVQLTSLADLRHSAETQVYAMRVMELYDRIHACRSRYWALKKRDRIEYGLRPEVGSPGYSITKVVALAGDLVVKAMRGTYPFGVDERFRFESSSPASFDSVRAVYQVVLPLVEDMEARLERVEKAVEERLLKSDPNHQK